MIGSRLAARDGRPGHTPRLGLPVVASHTTARPGPSPPRVAPFYIHPRVDQRFGNCYNYAVGYSPFFPVYAQTCCLQQRVGEISLVEGPLFQSGLVLLENRREYFQPLRLTRKLVAFPLL